MLTNYVYLFLTGLLGSNDVDEAYIRMVVDNIQDTMIAKVKASGSKDETQQVPQHRLCISILTFTFTETSSILFTPFLQWHIKIEKILIAMENQQVSKCYFDKV